LLVIAYDRDDKFDLPRNAEWRQKDEFASWLKEHQALCIRQAALFTGGPRVNL
jgi:hypothetical protein